MVVGVDVGGARKGFHAVALRNGAYWGRFSSTKADRVATWCRRIGAELVGIDAPCKWSCTGRAREAERALMRMAIWCFSTPTREAAVKHRSNHFGWMLAGESLYAALSNTYRLLGTDGHDGQGKWMFETFPHAVVCSLRGRVVKAGPKRSVRTGVLHDQGIDTDRFTSIDYVDAALCALTARFVAEGSWCSHGNAAEGTIIVPCARQ